MKKYISNKSFTLLIILLSLVSCIDDNIAGVGDLEDFTGPTPFYNISDVSSSEFDCSEVELSANYDFNFQAGSNLAVNGTQYEWKVTDENGNEVQGIELINKDLPILDLLIEAQKAEVVALEEAIADLEFKLPCEVDEAKKAVMQSEIDDLNVSLTAAEAALTQETLQAITDLENDKTSLEAATLEDQELIIRFPGPGTYNVGLTVTDNLGKSKSTERATIVNQAVPTIPIPEIAEAGFEDNSLFDGTGDGRDSWRTPSNDAWSPFGAGTTVIQINSKSEEGVLPNGIQAAKFPSDGARVAYQEIDVTPGAEYVLTYFTAFNMAASGQMKVSILKPTTSNYTEAQLEDNIIISRTDSNAGRVVDVFKQHAITFEAGENDSVIIFATNSGDEARLDAFAISIKQ